MVGLADAGVAVPVITGAHSPAAAILTNVDTPTSIRQPAGPTAPASSAAVLAELLKLLPPGKNAGPLPRAKRAC